MYITIEVRVSKDKYSYRDGTGKAEIQFEIDEIGAEYIIETLGPLMQSTAKTALYKFRNPEPENE